MRNARNNKPLASSKRHGTRTGLDEHSGKLPEGRGNGEASLRRPSGSGGDDMRAFAEALGGPGTWNEGHPEKFFADNANGTEGGAI